jgi:hypothetical protein
MIDRRIGKIKVRRGTDSQRKLVSFEEGELVYSIDTQRLYIGNGNTKGGILVSNRNYVKNSLGEPPIAPTEAIHGDIIHDKSNSKTYITKWNGTAYELILIGDSNCASQLQNEINDLNDRLNIMMPCLTAKPLPTPPVIPPIPTKLSWYSEPVGTSTNLGYTITLTSSAAGGVGTISYDWRRTDNVAVDSNTDRNLTLNNIKATDLATYYCIASNSTESITSRNATISLIPTTYLTWVIEPSDTKVNLGTDVVLYSKATGPGPITYTWKRRDGNPINSTNINLADLSIDNTSNSDIGTYYCEASNSTDTIISKNAVLDILSNSILTEVSEYLLTESIEYIDWEVSGLIEPTITIQPKSIITTTLVPVTFEITATGSDPLSYQWKINGVDVAGQTSRTYAITNPTKDITGIACIVSNALGIVMSNSVNLTVGIIPNITTQPIAQKTPVGSSVTFSVVAVGSDPLSYQWSKNGINISGATSSIYNINNKNLSDDGVYTCTVSNSFGSVTSNGAALST